MGIHYSFRYSFANTDPLLAKTCTKCGASFQTRARRKPRCNACQEARERARQARVDEAKRAARRAE